MPPGAHDTESTWPGDAASGIWLAKGGSCWRNTGHLDGLAPAAVPLARHERRECPAREIGRHRVAAASDAVARRNARHSSELAAARLVQRGEAGNLDGLPPASVPLPGYEYLGAT